MILLSLLATYLVLNILNILYIVGSNKAFTKENSFVGLLYDKDLLDKTDTFCSVFWKSNGFLLYTITIVSVLTFILTTLICSLIVNGWVVIVYGISIVGLSMIFIVAVAVMLMLFDYLKEKIINKFKTNKVKEEPKEEVKKPSDKKPNALLSGFKLWYDSVKNKYCPTIKFK